jgi:hypothetical protein
MRDRRALLALGSGTLAAAATAAPAAAGPGAATMLDHILIRQVFAAYARAVIRRDGGEVQAFFAPGAMVRNFTNRGGVREPGAGPLRADQMADYVDHAYHPYKPGMWSHILHTGEIVELDGDRARYSTQVTYLNAYSRGSDGAALSVPDILGLPHAGQVSVTNCGMWEAELVRAADAWRIAELTITVDLPYVASG